MSTIRPRVHRRDGKQVEGKGFSPDELKKAGKSLTEAVKLRIPVDPRRRTVHDENVEALKHLLNERKSAAKAKSKRKSKS
jgi:large subunit ribosomal protein L13e